MTSQEITMTIDTMKFGQARAYDDSIYEYNLTVSGMHDKEVELYCTRVLQPCSNTYEVWVRNRSNDLSVMFSGYYKFNKTGENTFNYYVCKPYID